MPKAKVVFVCVENAGRSQIAEGFAKRLGKNHLEAWSAGSQPVAKTNDAAVRAMKDHGIDISGQHPKGIADLPKVQWDYVVTMGCGDACPFAPSQARVDWDIPDPKSRPLEEVREICRRIEDEVTTLVRRAITDGYSAETR